MADLSTDVARTLKSQPVAYALADAVGNATPFAASDGAAQTIPVLVTALSEMAPGSARWQELVGILRDVDLEGLRYPPETIATNRHHVVGQRLIDLLIGSDSMSVSRQVAQQTELSQRGALTVMTAAAWLYVASATDRFDVETDPTGFQALVNQERDELAAMGWGPWFEGVTPTPVSEAVYPTEAPPTQELALPLTAGVNLGQVDLEPATVENPVVDAEVPIAEPSWPEPVPAGEVVVAESDLEIAEPTWPDPMATDDATASIDDQLVDSTAEPAPTDEVVVPAAGNDITEPVMADAVMTEPAMTGAALLADAGLAEPAADTTEVAAHQLVDRSSADDDLPVVGDAPVDGEAPVGDDTSVGDNASVEDDTSVEDEIPVGGEIPVGDEAFIDAEAFIAAEALIEVEALIDVEDEPLIEGEAPVDRAGFLPDDRGLNEPMGDQSVPAAAVPDTAAPLLTPAVQLPESRQQTSILRLLAPAAFLVGLVVVAALIRGVFSGESPPENATVAEAGAEVVAEATTTTASASTPAVADSADEPETLPPGEQASTTTVPSEPLEEAVVAMVDPTGSSDATGVAQVRLERETNRVCYDISVSDMGEPYEGHIHVGPIGVSGGIVVDFGQLNNSSSPGCVDVGAAEFAAMTINPSDYYVEMHDRAADIAIRAQLADDAQAVGEGAGGPFDPDAGGAEMVVGIDGISLEGEVADQEIFDLLAAELDGIDQDLVSVSNNLTIDQGAPPPTGGLVLDDSILFDVGSARLSDVEQTVLDSLAQLFTVREDWAVTVVGHADASGDSVLNLSLSLDRANAVRSALVDRGVPADRLAIEGPGSSDPIADNSTDEGRASNRRTEFRISRLP